MAVLKDRMENPRKNNLDILRFLAANLVIFSHAFPIIYGNNIKEPLYKLTDGQSTLGGLAVAIFFFISGFLITQSFEKSKSVSDYFKARILRIFPALIVCTILTVFVLGALLTSWSLTAYYSSPETYKHFIAMTTLNFLAPTLPGVFENNVFGASVNGSLWTLKFEFLFYIGIVIIGLMGVLKQRFMTIVLFVLFALLSLFDLNEHIHNLFKLGSFFMAGTIVYLYRDKIKLHYSLALISLILLIISTQFKGFNIALSIFGTYLVFYIGYAKVTYGNFTKYGDASYGIYIYAFPIQQMLMQLFDNNMNVLMNSVISFILAVLLSFISWHIIEKPALKLRKSPMFKQFKKDVDISIN